MFERLANAVLDHRLRSAAVLMLIFGSVAWGCVQLTADFSLMAFFAGDDPEVDFLAKHQAVWGSEESMLLLVITADDGGGVLTPKRLEALHRLDQALAKDANVQQVVSLASAARLRGEGQMIDVTPVIELAPQQTAEFERFKETLAQDRIFVPSLLAEDGSATSILIELDVNADAVEQVIPAVEAVRAIVATHDGQAGLRMQTAGVPAIRADYFTLLITETSRNLPTVFAVSALLLAFILRRVHGVVLPLIAAAVPTAMTFGAMGWTGEQVGVLNQNYFSLLPVLAIADAIHMVGRFHEEVRRRAKPGETVSPEVRRAAIVASAKHVGAACLLTSLTTGIGFASLYVARMPILRSYGLYAAAGIAFAYFTVLLIVPLLLSLTTGTVPESGRAEAPTLGDKLLLACANISTRHSAAVLLVTAGVIAGSVWLGSQVLVDNVLTRLLADDHPTNIATLVADRQLGGVIAAEVAFEGDEETLLSTEFLERLFALEAWAKLQPEARSVASVAGYVATLNEIADGAYAIPKNSDQVAQLLLLSEGDGGVDQILTQDRTATRALIRVKDEGGVAFDRFSARLQAELDQRFAGSTVTHHITGTAYVAYRGTNNVTLDLRNSLGLAFVAIGLVIALLFRNIRITLICFVPNALPLVVGYGMMGAMGWLLDPSPTVVFTLALGIAVDDTIHLMVRYREEVKAGLHREDAIRAAVLHSGRAVATTSIILTIGFLISAMSAFQALVIAGSLGAAVIMTALLADVFVLPALLVRYGE